MSKTRRGPVRIRKMSSSDIEFVAQIDRETFGSKHWPLEAFHQTVVDPSSNCWIIESLNPFDPIILGYGFQQSCDDTSHITNLCIHPARRSLGLGKILLWHMIDQAEELKHRFVELEVEVENKHAYHLYEAVGFRIDQYLPEYYSDTSDAYRMRLVLSY